MPAIEFRAGVDADFEFFFDLHKQTLGPYVDMVWGWADADQRAYMQRTLDLSTTRVVVVDGRDAGRLDLEHRDDSVYIALLEIAPEHQGRGIGRRIIGDILAAASADGKRVELRVLQVNTRAHQLYRRLGFIEVARTGTAPPIRIEMRSTPRVRHDQR